VLGRRSARTGSRAEQEMVNGESERRQVSPTGLPVNTA